MSRGFIGPLESLRGVAACMVAVYHSFAVFQIDGATRLWALPLQDVDSPEQWIARLATAIGNGGVAVTIFFVLSGVVLGLSLDQARGHWLKQYGAFLVKRGFRIYPAHILTTLVVIAALSLGVQFQEVQATTPWFRKWYEQPVDLRLVATNILLVNTYLNPVTWTLMVELVVALFFPAMYLVSRRSGPWLNGLALGALFILPILKPGGVILPQLCKFYVGLLIPLYGGALLSRLEGRPAQTAYWLAAVLLMPAERAFGISATAGLMEVTGAAMVIGGLLFVRSSHLWEHHWLRTMGRQSYSFYLWHFPAMYLMARLWATAVPDRTTSDHALLVSALLCLCSVVVANLLAWLTFRTLEAPFVRHGKQVAAFLFPGDAHR